jgi:hypothetical protein
VQSPRKHSSARAAENQIARCEFGHDLVSRPPYMSRNSEPPFGERITTKTTAGKTDPEAQDYPPLQAQLS